MFAIRIVGGRKTRGGGGVAYAWADAGDDGDRFAAGHGAEVGEEGGETSGGVHALFDGGKRVLIWRGGCFISKREFQ